MQKRKIGRVFEALDRNADGLLEETDFAALTERWAELGDVGPGSPEHVRLIVVMMGWWRTLLAASAGTALDTVTMDDVLGVIDDLGELRNPVTATATTLFDAVDEDGDGLVTATEYRRMIEAWSGRSTDTDEVFPLLDLDGDGLLSRAEFAELWTDFWAGDDPRSPGNWVFGRFELPVPQYQ
ncbi:calcium sensor EFh [Actinophytocola xanthii]|uniref:Calcium sensor EFh n=1 Tax=Actinophytocola xanthii TaxID=1912961 RepID=A0A1Q8CJY2_9PSEU|nr:calcium sensor EFh [Actinophytocola xanthii]